MENNLLKKRQTGFLLAFIILIGILLVVPLISSEPSGVAGLTEERTERATETPALNHSAIAGNLTEITLYGYSTTRAWQGYFGNVTGTIQLAYGSEPGTNEYVFYNWSIVDAQGQVYASTNSSIQWENIQCFNFTATGAIDDTDEEPGEMNLKGMNVTQLEESFNITSRDVDGVNETFTSTTHSLFYVISYDFENICQTVRTFNSSGIPTFEQVLMYEPESNSVIFTSLLKEGGVVGFDGGTYDFQMLFLEDGHGTNIETTTYYFFVELM